MFSRASIKIKFDKNIEQQAKLESENERESESETKSYFDNIYDWFS